MDLARWPLLVLAEHGPDVGDTQMETAAEAPGQLEAAVSELFGPRPLEYLVLQLFMGKASEVSSMASSPSLSSAAGGVAPSKQRSLQQPADSLLSAHIRMSQLSVSSCTPLIHLPVTELPSLP